MKERKEIYPKVFLYEDFLTEEESLFIYNYCESATKEEWESHYIEDQTKKAATFFPDDIEKQKEFVKNVNSFWSDKILEIKDQDLVYKLHQRLDLIEDPKTYRFNQPRNIQRQLPDGDNLKVHADRGEGNPIVFAIVIYVNDNYQGGEIYFPQHDFQVKPPARSLLLFPGTDDYLHGVMKVSGGSTRYVLPSFVYNLEEQEVPVINSYTSEEY